MYPTQEVERDYDSNAKYGPAELTKQGEIMAEVEQLHELVMQLEKEFEVFSQRISPVIENVPTPGTGENPKAQRNSDLAMRLSSANQGLHNTIQRMRETRNRIAL